VRRLFARAWILAAAAGLCAPAAATATPAADPCAEPTTPPVVLVHDIASDAGAWDELAADLGTAGRCILAITWGAPEPAHVPVPFAGLRGVDAGARDLAAALAGAGTVDVVAHGVGGLVVQRYLQDHGSRSVRSLTTLGPIWDGTEIGGLAAAEEVSRRIGTYDLVLSLEKPVIDPVCAGCREVIHGSDLLRDLYARGPVTDGVRYTDIVSTCDGFVVPATGASMPGTTVVTLQERDPGNCAGHFALPRDPLARALALDAVEHGGV